MTDAQQAVIEFGDAGEGRTTVVDLAAYRRQAARAAISQDVTPAASEIRWDWSHKAPRALSAAAIAHRGRMLRHLAGTTSQA